MMTRYRTALAATALAFTASLSAPTVAQEATPWPEMMMRMADVNKDGVVSRQEYLDMAAKMWDEKHGKMMKTDSSMKARMMNKSQFTGFVKNMYMDPANIGGN